MENLYVEPHLTFEKVSSESVLPEDPNAWPTEITQELYKQVPYMAEFEPHVVMDRVDAERGYAFCHVEVMNRTELPRGADPGQTEAAGVKQARIPIIVKDRKLQPFDVIITEDSKVLPLTEARIRQAIFRPQAFDITSKTPGDISMIGQLYPPYRQGGGGMMMGGTGDTGGMGMMGKQGSADSGCYKCGKPGKSCICRKMQKSASLLEAILPTINSSDYEGLFDKLAHDENLQAALLENRAGCARALAILADHEPLDISKTASALENRITPSVVQVQKAPSGYLVKSASHLFWDPKFHILDRGDVCRIFGEKVALAADNHGSATMAEGAEEGAEPATDAKAGGSATESNEGHTEADTPALITQFGVYKVQDDQGRHIIGYVFPNLMDTDGTSLPLALFTNGSQAAVQGEIVGVDVGGGASLFEGPPSGHGAFYHVLPTGKAQAIIPITITSSLTNQGEYSMQAETFDGRAVEVAVQPNIQEVMEVDGKMLVPDTFSWLPLDKADEVVLSSDPVSFQKTAHPARPFTTVQIRGCGVDTFSISGLPLAKFASEATDFVSFDDAVFLLSGLGIDPGYATEKIAMASNGLRPIEVRIGRGIKLASVARHESQVKAASIMADWPDFRRDLLKEAAVIPDPVAVDTVLSLGFINPENLSTFIGYLPLLDEAQSRMCELLVAARLGLRATPVSALEKAIRSTEEVVSGLRVMAFQGT